MESVAYGYMHVFYRVKAYISNGWDKTIVDPDPQKKYTARKAQAADSTTITAATTSVAAAGATAGSVSAEAAYDADGWPKGLYTQQIQGVLPAILTDDIITTHLKSSGKQLHPKKRRKLSEDDDNSTADTGSYCNVDYSTLQRGHQYFMESYIPGRYVRFCCKDGQIWIRARCYRSQKKNDSMLYVNVALACEPPHYVTRALCSCTAGKSGMCSHVVG